MPRTRTRRLQRTLFSETSLMCGPSIDDQYQSVFADSDNKCPRILSAAQFTLASCFSFVCPHSTSARRLRRQTEGTTGIPRQETQYMENCAMREPSALLRLLAA